jgi:anti-sigma factor RsiW
MTCPGGHCDDLIASYLLGGCPPREAAMVTEHLGQCDTCAGEARRLSTASGALLADVVPMAPPSRVKDRVMAQVRAEAELFNAAATLPRGARSESGFRAGRGTWRDRLWLPRHALATACALLLVVAVGAALLSSLDSEGGASTLTAQVDVRQAPGASATLEVHEGEGRLTVRGLPAPGPGRVYQVWLREDGQAPRPADAEFSVGAGGRGQVRLPGDIAGADQLLVTSEPAGGSSLPTRIPVLQVDTSPA